MKTWFLLLMLLSSPVALAGSGSNYAYVRDLVSGLSSTTDNYASGTNRWLASDGEQIVVYSPDNTVRRYDMEGAFQSELTVGPEVDAIDLGPSGELAVASTQPLDILVRVFEADNSLRWTVSLESQGEKDLAIGPNGNVFVIANEEVREFDAATGSLVSRWGSAGTGNGLPGEIVLGRGIRVTEDRVYLQVSGPTDPTFTYGAIDAYHRDGTFVDRIATYYVNGDAVRQSLVLTQGAVFASNGGFGIYRLSTLNRNLDIREVSMPQELIPMPAIPSLNIDNLNGQLVVGDRILRLNSRAGAVTEYRQGSHLIPGVDSPAFPVPFITAQSTRPGEPVLDLSYDIDDIDSAQVDIALLARLNGGDQVQDWLRPTSFLEGTGANLGTVEVANAPLGVTWDYGADLDGLTVDAVDLRLEILALDGRGLLGASLVELPAGIPESATQALVISTLSFRSSDFADAYRWLFASGDPAVVKQGNTLVGTTESGEYEGVVLLDGQAATDDGIDFLLAREGLRRATADEVSRAREAATVGTTNQFEPFNSLADRPEVVNEYGVETTQLNTVIYAVPAL